MANTRAQSGNEASPHKLQSRSADAHLHFTGSSLRPGIVDSQWHEPAPWLDWSRSPEAVQDAVFTECVMASMEASGVERLVLFPTLRHEGWAERTSQLFPETFTVVPCFNYLSAGEERPTLDASTTDIEEQLTTVWSKPAVRALRFVLTAREENLRSFLQGDWNHAFELCKSMGIPIFLYATGRLDLVADIARRYPDLLLVVDHMGLPQPPMEMRDVPPWRALPDLLALSRFANVHVKMCGVPSLSTQPFPYRDTWQHVRRIVDAFGSSRLAWASDIGRFRGAVGWHYRATPRDKAYPGRHNYAEALALFRWTELLTEDEKSDVLGGTIRSLLKW